MQARKYLTLLTVGGLTFNLIETLWRGWTHWTMFFLGGICFICLGLINEVLSWDTLLWQQALLGSVIITTLEFITGCIVNLWLKWAVWDYSSMPLNLLGQICLPYSLLWVLLSVVGILLDDYLRWRWYGEEKPRYKLL